MSKVLDDLEQIERAAIYNLNQSVCRKTSLLNEVVDLMNQKLTKEELIVLKEELVKGSSSNKSTGDWSRDVSKIVDKSS